MCKYLYERVEPCIQRYIYLDVFLLGEAIYICKYCVFIFPRDFYICFIFNDGRGSKMKKNKKKKNDLILFFLFFFVFFHFLRRVDYVINKIESC